MPQPVSRIVRDAKISLRADALADKPEMAILVTEIFAVWAEIEYQLSLLLVQVLGATESPAIAMHSILTSQQLQAKALDAAAKAALSAEQYEIFDAVTSVIESVQTPRNHLAHWLWGICAQRPDLLALADPKMYKANEISVRRFLEKDFEVSDAYFTDAKALKNVIDPEHVFAYSKADLERAKRDLLEARAIIVGLGIFLNPAFLKSLLSKNRRTGKAFEKVDPAEMQTTALALLNKYQLFQEALAEVRKRRKKTD